MTKLQRRFAPIALPGRTRPKSLAEQNTQLWHERPILGSSIEGRARIADLAGSENIESLHIAAAIQYPSLGRRM